VRWCRVRAKIVRGDILAPMKPLVLFEDEGFADLLPLVFWRSVFEIQLGRKILLDRFAQRLGRPVSGVWTRDWMAPVAGQRCGAPANRPLSGPTLLVNGRWRFDAPVEFPDSPCVGTIEGAPAYIVCDEKVAAALTPLSFLEVASSAAALERLPKHDAPGKLLRYPWDLVSSISADIEGDWTPTDAGVLSDVPEGVLTGPKDRLRIGESVSLHRTSLIDTASGSVYLGDSVAVGPYAVLEGPLYIGPGSVIRPHSWLHGGNSIGPVCKIGGEVHGCLIHGYTNKQHEGFLGHCVVGSWVNIGAGAANSDLKNTYGAVRCPINGSETDTGLTFFGAVIGDHAKLGIHATIPTGAVIGFATSVFTSEALPKYLPSFSWATREGTVSGDPLRAMDVAAKVMARRNVDLTDEEVELFLDLGRRVKQFESRRH